MKTLICTPCYGAQVSVHYLQSLLVHTFNAPERLQAMGQRHSLQQSMEVVKSGQTDLNAEEKSKYLEQTQKLLNALPNYDLAHFPIGHESLISRARNTCAQKALDNGFDYLLFIDADSSWKWPDVEKILRSTSPIVAGLVPFKQYPETLNFHPFKEDEKFIEANQGKNVRAAKALAAHYKSAEIEVNYVGTAFMRIHTDVFRKLIDMGARQYKNLYMGDVHTFHDFFKVFVDERGQYHSEDWGFCHFARQAGYKIMAHTGVYIDHVGNHTYKAGQVPVGV